MSTWSPPPLIRNPWLRWGLVSGAIAYLVLALSTLEPDVPRILRGLGRGAEILASFARPDFTSRWQDIGQGILESVVMTVVATVVGIMLSVPVGFGAARNLVPAPVYFCCRGAIALSRTLHELVLAIFFVAMLGFGPLAGVCTLAISTVGFLGKLLADDLEEIDAAPVDAIRSTGASWLQVMHYAVFPQVQPRLIGLSLYRFDINLRESAIVGIVGAGGIGTILNTSLQRYEYGIAAAVLLAIITLVLLVELTSGWIRGRVQ